MGTPTNDGFDFSSNGDLVTGTGPYIDTSRLKADGADNDHDVTCDATDDDDGRGTPADDDGGPAATANDDDANVISSKSSDIISSTYETWLPASAIIRVLVHTADPACER